MKETTLFVCAGRHCRKAFAREASNAKHLSRLAVPIRYVGCQKVCKGPVVGLRIDGELQWFRQVDSRKAWDALAELIEDGTLARPLRKRMDRKRSGRLRE